MPTFWKVRSSRLYRIRFVFCKYILHSTNHHYIFILQHFYKKCCKIYKLNFDTFLHLSKFKRIILRRFGKFRRILHIEIMLKFHWYLFIVEMFTEFCPTCGNSRRITGNQLILQTFPGFFQCYFSNCFDIFRKLDGKSVGWLVA